MLICSYVHIQHPQQSPRCFFILLVYTSSVTRTLVCSVESRMSSYRRIRRTHRFTAFKKKTFDVTINSDSPVTMRPLIGQTFTCVPPIRNAFSKSRNLPYFFVCKNQVKIACSQTAREFWKRLCCCRRLP